MKYNPQIHHRRSIRLKGYDYSQAGLYFITICVKDRQCLFGKIENHEMILNDAGIMINKWWQKIPEKFPDIELDVYQVMPNHFHAIVFNTGIGVGANPRVRPITDDKNTIGANPRVRPITDDKNTIGANPRVRPITDDKNTIGANPRVRPITVDKNNTPIVPNIYGNADDGQTSHDGQTRGSAPTDDNKNNNDLSVRANPRVRPITDDNPEPILGEHVGSPLHRIVQWFKTMSTNEYIRGVKTLGWSQFNGKLLQRNYYEHIVRNEQSYQTISEYILNNPAKWNDDKFFNE